MRWRYTCLGWASGPGQTFWANPTCTGLACSTGPIMARVYQPDLVSSLSCRIGSGFDLGQCTVLWQHTCLGWGVGCTKQVGPTRPTPTQPVLLGQFMVRVIQSDLVLPPLGRIGSGFYLGQFWVNYGGPGPLRAH